MLPTQADQDMALDRAVEEIRAINEGRAEAARQEQRKIISCPDCMATLKLETNSPLPDDLRVVFVQHH